MLDILKKLQKSIKILMLISAVIVIVFLVSLITKIFILAIICAIAFFACASIITVIYFKQTNEPSLNEEKYIKQISELINNSDSLELKDVAKQFNLTEPQTRHLVFECFKNKLIEGYSINGDKVSKIELISQENEEVKVVQCVGCGARFTSSSKIKKCPYCGNIYD